MANEEQKKVSRIKDKKKSWFTIIAPKVFGLKEMGESYLSTPAEAVGRVMKINLKELTGNVKDQNASIGFKVMHIQNNKLMTSAIGYYLSPAYVKRVVRKNIDRKDDYMVLKTRDNKEVIVKTLIVTLNKTKKSIRTKMSALMKESLKEEVSQLTFNTLINGLVLQKIQYPLKKKLSKIYPLRELAVRSLFLKDNSLAGEDAEGLAKVEVSKNVKIPAKVTEAKAAEAKEVEENSVEESAAKEIAAEKADTAETD